MNKVNDHWSERMDDLHDAFLSGDITEKETKEQLIGLLSGNTHSADEHMEALIMEKAREH